MVDGITKVTGFHFSTSESIGRPPVTVDHPPGVARSATRHPATVVEGLRLPAEAGPLLGRLLLMASGLFLGMEGTDYWKHKWWQLS